MWKPFCLGILSLVTTVIGLAVLFILILPFLLIKFLVSGIARTLKPNLERGLSSTAVLSFIDKKTDIKLISVTVNGRIDYDSVCDSFTEKIINSISQDGSFQFPQLQQRITSWLGYFFWENETNFDIRNHVSLWKVEDGEVVTQEQFKPILNHIFNTELDTVQSPWKIWIVPNTRIQSDPPGIGNKTTLVLHFHPLLQIELGFQISYILQKWIAVSSESEIEDTNTQISPIVSRYTFRNVVMWIRTNLANCSRFLQDILNQRREKIDWTSRKYGDVWSGNVSVDILEPVPVTLLNDITNLYVGSNVESVILTVYAGAVRRFLIQHLIKPPASCSVSFEDALGTIFQVDLPVEKQGDTKNRLALTATRLKNLTSGSTVKTILDILTALPNWLGCRIIERVKEFVSVDLCFIQKSIPNVEDNEKQLICNSEIIGIQIFQRSHYNTHGPTLVCNMYGGFCQLLISGESNIFLPSLPLKDLSTFIMKELTDLLVLEPGAYV